MKTSNRRSLSGRFALSLAILLVVPSLALYGQDDKKEEKKPSRPAPTHSAPAPSNRPADAPARSAPERVHTAAPPTAPSAGHPQESAPAAAPGRRYGTQRNSDAAPSSETPRRTPANGAAPDARPANPAPNTGGGTNNARPAYTPGGVNNARPVTNNGRPAANNDRPANPSGGRVFGSNGGGGGNPGARNDRAPVIVRTPNGGVVRRAPDGYVREVRTPSGAIIRHAPNGVRNVEVIRPGNRIVVARSYGGYVQRPVVYRGHDFVQRTYIYGGRPIVRVYNPYRWGGITVNIYRPVRYYPVSYYTYAYSPWVRPVRWSWGWGIGTPWYGFYGGWFTPYPVYASPSLWLTDYLVATTLEEAYRERMAARADAIAAANANYGQTPLTEDVKQAISDEVRRQLDQERAEQQNANYQPVLFGGGGEHVFVVANALNAMSDRGECVLTEGDVLHLGGSPPMGTELASVNVMASKGGECRRGSIVTVAVADLQEMQNHMRATLDQGLEEMRNKQGQGDMPRLPPAAAAPVVQAPYAADIQADPAAGSEIAQVSQESERSEQEIVNQAGAPNQAAGPVTIAMGQTTDEVVAVLGQPSKTADLGPKQIYIYKDMKITFTNGRVTDVQ
jgi:hypothetical protein